jgi:N-acetylglutamate synthase-like GNAT family acetyltransferase
MITYRTVKIEDFDQLIILLKQLGYLSTSNNLSERIEEIKKDNRGCVFVAVDVNGIIIGCVHALIDIRLAGGTFGEIVSLVVDDRMHGQGIGKGLIDTATEYLRTKGLKRIRVRCNSIREDAHKFYEHLGFVEKKSQKIFEKNI